MVVDGYTLVSVRAFDRPGFDGFCRGGRRWSSKEDTIALVSPALLAVLKGEKKMLAVDSGIELDAEALKLVPRIDLPPKKVEGVDPAALALFESQQLDQEIARLEAIAANEEKRAKLEALKKGKAPATEPEKKSDKK